MGNYNPRAPLILGEEWVPIRDEDVVYSPAVNAFELGQAFTLTTSRALAETRFYINESVRTAGQIYMSSIYPEGAEDDSGPIRSLVIPVNAGTITGSGITLVGAANVAEAMLDPSDLRYIAFSNFGSAQDRVSFFFAVNNYPNLQGKRILACNILYVVGGPANYYETTDVNNIAIYPQLRNDLGSTVQFEPRTGFVGTTVAANTSPSDLPRIKRCELGEVAWFWGTNTAFNTSVRVPQIYSSLQQLEASATNRYAFNLLLVPSSGLNSNAAELSYLGIEVIYCDETRVAFGGRHFGSSSNISNIPYVVGTNPLAMYSTSQVATPTLAAGTYVQTLYSANMGLWETFSSSGSSARDSQYPDVNGIRQLYEIPSHPAVRINIPVPLWDHINEEFGVEQSMILPQLSGHLTSGTLTEPHSYGRQGAAQVWGTNTATQEIYDDIVGVSTVYQQVRYYARRFGDTTVPLKLIGLNALSGSTVSITPADFDQLAEILDGWREVTLRFATAPTMGTLATPDPSWTWSAAGEKAGNRWEILAACAPALSGIPGNLYNQVTAVHRLGTATYQPTAGDTVELTWMPQGVASPYVSGSTADPGCDAVLIFSVDPQTVTGVSISQQSQVVSGTGLDCGNLPCCIPSGIGYQRVTWGLPPNTGVASDSFTRTVAAGSWGDADVGGTYTLSGTAADFSVNGTQGVVVSSSTAADRYAVLPAGIDFDVTVDAAVTTVPGGAARAGVTGRYTDASNNYVGRYEVDSAGAVTLSIIKRVAGVQTTVATAASNTLAGGSGAFLTLRFMGAGTLLKLKVWPTGEPEPAMWNLEATDTSLTTGSLAGAYTRDATSTNSYLFDNLTIGPPAYWFGAYELQRFDYLDPTGDFQTIMLATDVSLTSFNDYEARVGIPSVYRIRSLNALNFAGAWSTYVTGTVTSPGVSGGACGDLTGVLIFTSNADQTGANNAAYIMQWERDPTEEFALPEAGMVEYQPMYGRDGAVAFHGTERGLETFSRTVLLQAAAISPIALADASTIRDLAWANLPYVCVRDELGDRWFANIRVPNVTVRHNRTKYMARIDIVETTATPYPVSP